MKRLFFKLAPRCKRIPGYAFNNAWNNIRYLWLAIVSFSNHKNGCRISHLTKPYHEQILLSAGVDLRTVAGKLGHASTTATQIVYSRLLRETEQKTASVMERLLTERHAEPCCTALLPVASS